MNKSYDNFINKLLFYYNKHIPLIPNSTHKKKKKCLGLQKEYYTLSKHVIDFIKYVFVTQPCSIKKITKDTVTSSLL